MNQDKKPYVIGLDLGGTNSVFGIVDANANVVAEVSVKTRGHNDNAQQYVDDCVVELRKIIEQVGGIEKIGAMGIGAPNGNYYTGCIEFAPNLAWAHEIVPLAKMFSDALGIPVALTNDANAAAIGEMTYGAAKGMKNFIMITLGTGVGSGIVVNGQMVYGCDGMAGELGHVIVEKNGRECGCGRKGCLETYCSATGIARTAREILEKTDRPTLLRDTPINQVDGLAITLAARKGDPVALEIFEFTGRMLGEACANFATFNSPEAFVFFGGLSKAGDLIMDPIKRAYDETVLKIYRGKAKMLLSQLDDAKAAVLGASAVGWELIMHNA
ncbi:MAG: ROK family protein [Bacteroidaceae bacterium]|nr:ROK family protein [Bacteroidaceae bacterium]